MLGTWIVVVKPRPFLEQPDKEELRRERRDREIKTLDAQRGQAEDDPDARREEARQRDRDHEVHARKDGRQLVAGIGADAHEGRRAERQLPGIAGKKVQPKCRQRIDQNRDEQRLEDELVGAERQDHPCEKQDHAKQDRVLPHGKQREIRFVAGLELAGRPVKHSSIPAR